MPPLPCFSSTMVDNAAVTASVTLGLNRQICTLLIQPIKKRRSRYCFHFCLDQQVTTTAFAFWQDGSELRSSVLGENMDSESKTIQKTSTFALFSWCFFVLQNFLKFLSIWQDLLYFVVCWCKRWQKRRSYLKTPKAGSWVLGPGSSAESCMRPKALAWLLSRLRPQLSMLRILTFFFAPHFQILWVYRFVFVSWPRRDSIGPKRMFEHGSENTSSPELGDAEGSAPFT